MTLADALAALAARVAPVPASEQVALAVAAGRILAEDVRARHAVPPYDNAAVDGYAFRFADLAAAAAPARLAVHGRAAAGHRFTGAVPEGAAVRIFTGAAMPMGLDTVAMQEDCRQEGGFVDLPAQIGHGANRRLAGEDVAAGALALARGQRLRAQDIGLAAAVGRDRLLVYRRLRAAVFSTGDELRAPGAALGQGEIHDANRYALIALLEGLGATVSDLGIVADRAADITAALAAAAQGHDVIVTSGGMSVGEEDHVKDSVRALGQLHFWRLAIKPGRPIGLGEVAGVPFIGLPGNPVAMIVTFLRLARPLLLGLAGATLTAPRLFRVTAAFSHAKKPGRREWLRARLATGDDGAPVAIKFPREGSGILSSLVASDGLVELAEDVAAVEPGMAVDFLPFSELG